VSGKNKKRPLPKQGGTLRWDESLITAHLGDFGDEAVSLAGGTLLPCLALLGNPFLSSHHFVWLAPCSTGGIGDIQRSPSDEAENDEIGEHSPDGSDGDGGARPHGRLLLRHDGSHGEKGNGCGHDGPGNEFHGVTTKEHSDYSI